MRLFVYVRTALFTCWAGLVERRRYTYSVSSTVYTHTVPTACVCLCVCVCLCAYCKEAEQYIWTLSVQGLLLTYVHSVGVSAFSMVD